jgi:hypothetical protein
MGSEEIGRRGRGRAAGEVVMAVGGCRWLLAVAGARLRLSRHGGEGKEWARCLLTIEVTLLRREKHLSGLSISCQSGPGVAVSNEVENGRMVAAAYDDCRPGSKRPSRIGTNEQNTTPLSVYKRQSHQHPTQQDTMAGSPPPEDTKKADAEARAKEQAEQAALPYKWDQTIKDLDITISIDAKYKGKDLDVKIGRNTLKVGIKGQEPFIDVCYLEEPSHIMYINS